jgi:helix-turn-helix protein
MWELYEPYHASIYFAAEGKEIYTDAGLKGGWMAYFASRAAALGAVPPEVVIATFYNFHPKMVRRSIPDAWDFVSPEAVLEARLRVADACLSRMLGDNLGSADLIRANELAREAVGRCDVTGRPLFAANLALEPPTKPHLELWHWTTCLREHRGDGHVACLVAEDIDGCQAHVLMAAAGVVPADMQRAFRGWTEEEWNDAAARLQERGYLNEDGELSRKGAEFRARVEERTDQLALRPWAALGEGKTEEFARLMRSLVTIMVEEDGIPYPNPMGLTPLRLDLDLTD